MARWFKAGALGRSEYPKPGPAPRSSSQGDPLVYEIEFFDADRMGSIPKPISKARRDADPTGKVQPLDE